jgi:hypothetical protein
MRLDQRAAHQFRDVLDIDLVERFGDTQQSIQPAQLGDECPGGGAVVLVGPLQPARPCKLRQGRRGLVKLEVQNIGQDNRVHQPVRQVVDRSDLVRNGMDISNARLCEGKARLT